MVTHHVHHGGYTSKFKSLNSSMSSLSLISHDDPNTSYNDPATMGKGKRIKTFIKVQNMV